MRRKKKFLVGMILAVISILLVVFATNRYFSPKIIRDTKTYVSNKENFEGKSGLLIFPDQVRENETEEYCYWCKRNFFFSDIQVYLRCKYSKERFLEEIDRLSEISLTYTWKSGERQTHTLHYNIDDYILPAYEAISGYGHSYEYALIDEKNSSISYIFLQYVDKEDVIFNKQMLPQTYEENGDGMELFNIYAFAVDGDTSKGAYMVYE